MLFGKRKGFESKESKICIRRAIKMSMTDFPMESNKKNDVFSDAFECSSLVSQQIKLTYCLGQVLECTVDLTQTINW